MKIDKTKLEKKVKRNKILLLSQKYCNKLISQVLPSTSPC